METEKKPQAKKEWKTPELIVLVRSKPEEAVLVASVHHRFEHLSVMLSLAVPVSCLFLSQPPLRSVATS